MNLNFSDVKPVEALSFAFKRGNKILGSKEYYQDILYKARSASWSIAGFENLAELNMIFKSLNQAMNNGSTFDEWKSSISQLNSFEMLPEWRKQLIFRQFNQTAYNAGYWKSIQAMKDVMPYLMYSAILDSRVRPEHRALNQTIKLINDPFWRKFFPPNGYNCRCTAIQLTSSQAKNFGGETPNEDLKGIQIDDGWDYHPSNSHIYLNKYLKQQIDASEIPDKFKYKLKEKYDTEHSQEYLARQVFDKTDFAKLKGMATKLDNQLKLSEQYGITKTELMAGISQFNSKYKGSYNYDETQNAINQGDLNKLDNASVVQKLTQQFLDKLPSENGIYRFGATSFDSINVNQSVKLKQQIQANKSVKLNKNQTEITIVGKAKNISFIPNSKNSYVIDNNINYTIKEILDQQIIMTEAIQAIKKASIVDLRFDIDQQLFNNFKTKILGIYPDEY